RVRLGPLTLHLALELQDVAQEKMGQRFNVGVVERKRGRYRGAQSRRKSGGQVNCHERVHSQLEETYVGNHFVRGHPQDGSHLATKVVDEKVPSAAPIGAAQALGDAVFFALGGSCCAGLGFDLGKQSALL